MDGAPGEKSSDGFTRGEKMIILSATKKEPIMEEKEAPFLSAMRRQNYATSN